jgi:hypothetical protein
MLRDDLIAALKSMEPDEICELLEGSSLLDNLVDKAVAEEVKDLQAERDDAFDEGRAAGICTEAAIILEMLAEGRIDDVGNYIESLGSNRLWSAHKADALMGGRLFL